MHQAENIAFRNFSDTIEQNELKNKKAHSQAQSNLMNTIQQRVATIEAQKLKIEELELDLKIQKQKYQHKEHFYQGEITIYKKIKEKMEVQIESLQKEVDFTFDKIIFTYDRILNLIFR